MAMATKRGDSKRARRLRPLPRFGPFCLIRVSVRAAGRREVKIPRHRHGNTKFGEGTVIFSVRGDFANPRLKFKGKPAGVIGNANRIS